MGSSRCPNRIIFVCNESSFLIRGEPQDVLAEQRVIACAQAVAAALAGRYLEGLHRRNGADEALYAALMLGQTAGYLRLFVDLGPRLVECLERKIPRNSRQSRIKDSRGRSIR